MNDPKILTLERWAASRWSEIKEHLGLPLDLELDDIDLHETNECETCDGSGDTYCDNCAKYHSCACCDGDGESGEVGDGQKVRELYEDQVKADKAKLSRFLELREKILSVGE